MQMNHHITKLFLQIIQCYSTSSNILEISGKKQGPHKFLCLLQWLLHHRDFLPQLYHDP